MAGITPRIFVSYAHEDSAAVREDVSFLSNRGFTMVSDTSIAAGEDWRTRIAESLMSADIVLFYSSSHSNGSRHCLAEVGFALDHDKPIVVVMLEDRPLAAGLRLYLGRLQGVQRFRETHDEYRQSLQVALGDAQADADSEATQDLQLRLSIDADGTADPALIELVNLALRWAFATVPQVRLIDDEGEDAVSVRVGLSTTGDVRIARIQGPGQAVEEIGQAATDTATWLTAIVNGVVAALDGAAAKVPELSLEDLADADSPEVPALARYLRGLLAGRHGDYANSLKDLEGALECDPRFALAARAAAVSCQVLGEQRRLHELFEIAFDGLPRLPPGQRARTKFVYYLSSGDHQRAIPEMESYLRAYPGNPGVRDNLALAYLYSRNIDAAITVGRENATRSNNYIAQSNYAMYLMYAGNFAQAEAQLLESDLRRDPYAVDATMAICRAMQGDSDAARMIFEAMRLGDPIRRRVGTLGLADLLACAGRIDEAVAVLESETDDPAQPMQLTLEGWRALHAARLGRRGPEALARMAPGLRAAIEDPLSPSDAWLLASAAIALEVPEIAMRVIDTLKRRSLTSARVYATLIEAQLATADGAATDAVRLLREANEELDTWLGHYLLAIAHRAAGERLDMRAELDTCLQRSGESVAVMLDEVPTMHLHARVLEMWDGRSPPA